jgi:hypothetical protein
MPYVHELPADTCDQSQLPQCTGCSPHAAWCGTTRYNPYAVASRIRELEDEVQALKVELSPLYSQLILSHSTYEKPQQDRWVAL